MIRSEEDCLEYREGQEECKEKSPSEDIWHEGNSQVGPDWIRGSREVVGQRRAWD